MTLDPSISLVVSFFGFVLVFVKKVYPLATVTLDEHIESVKRKIADAECQRTAANQTLAEATQKKNDVVEVITSHKKASADRLEKLRQENDEYLKTLSARLKASLKAQLEAETIKQRDLLLKKISQDLIAKIITHPHSSAIGAPSIYTNEDLQKLMPTD
jgi:F0F1-type ATP synthase membrane subunit b/b'